MVDRYRIEPEGFAAHMRPSRAVDMVFSAEHDVCIAELEAEVERLRRLVMAQSRAIHSPETLSRTGAVKAKALEWDKGVVDCAKPLPGMRYNACGTTPAGSWAWWLDDARGTRAVLASEAEAKAAAQADYERRILSTLEPAAPEGQQEPVAWQRRVKFPKAPGAKPQWEQCSAGEATDHFARRPGCEYRPLYTRPSEQAVTDKMIGVANSAFLDAFFNGDGSGRVTEHATIRGVDFDVCMRAAFKAAMEAGR